MGLKGIKHPLTCFSSSSLRSDQSCPGGTKASFVSLGMGRIQGGSSVGFPIQLHSKTTVRFGPAQEKKHSGFVPSPAHTVRCNPRVHPSGSNPSHCDGREVARRRRDSGGARGEEAAARGGGLAPRGGGLEARIHTGELFPYHILELPRSFLPSKRLPTSRPLLLPPLRWPSCE
jgi:hypothetical protein